MGWLEAVAAYATLALLIGLCYRPLGDYIAWVFTSRHHSRVERAIYRFCGVRPRDEQTWREYLGAILAFSLVGLVFLYALQRLQPWLPYSLGFRPVSPHLAFNTAASFVANTDWQAYSPEQTLGYTVQMLGIGVQMFTSAAVGMSVAVALIRGIMRRRRATIGNFWVDLVRVHLRLLLPLAVITAVVFIAGGVVQNFLPTTEMATITGGRQWLPGGPAASHEAIKLLGTNGGGFFNANSAHPFENPSGWVNLVQIFALLVIPFCLPRTFGKIVRDQRLGFTILATMGTLFTAAYALVTWAELSGSGTVPQLAGAAMEGKEQRFGIAWSTLFATATTGTSGGAANSTHDSYTALGGMWEMLHMALGELSPGGVGTGLYTMLVMVIIAVFIAGLLLGRAPVLLGKRVGVTEMKLASAFILVPPVLALGGMAITYAIPQVRAGVTTGNPGSHGMSEIFYAFISASVNNGSAFGGLDANTPWLNVTLGIVMLLGRFVPIALTLAIAGSLAMQDRATRRRNVVPGEDGADSKDGTVAPGQVRAAVPLTQLPLHRPQFVILLLIVIIYITLPTFVPILMTGPLAEGFGGP